jgi:hypothetical protein
MMERRRKRKEGSNEETQINKKGMKNLIIWNHERKKEGRK